VIFDWSYALQTLPVLLKASEITLEATGMGAVIAMTLGLLWAILRRSTSRILSWPVALIVEFVRGTPLLVQIYFLFYVLPDTGIRLSPLVTGTLALGLHYSAYCSEIYRAGIDGVARGQWEAAIALNLSRFRTFRAIVIPQAVPPIVPALGNRIIAMFKDTPLLSAITVMELLQTAKVIGAENFRYTEPLTMVGVIFLVFSLISAQGVRWLERHIAIGTA
jgi:polar amino acid transport system permease protein